MGRKLSFCKNDALGMAAKLLSAKGYEKTCMRDVSDAMQIPVASLYHSFGDKQQLLQSVLDHYYDNQMKPQMAALAGAENSYDAIHDYFTQMIRQAKSCEGQAGCIMLHAASELGTDVPPAATSAKKMLAYAKEQFAAAITRGQENNQITRAQNVEFLSAYLVAQVIALNAWLRMDASETQLVKYVDQALSLIRT
ncbi:MAG TPA: TetR/AcrR family transcriptional regulator [Alphaproteobacteria bacterium]|nr:hypothetical protein [Rhodospirillaceae bacterium]HRJ11983.1 TetR/AcrR family transcriptional regulator [Alphaproteobacteria bacterium]